ncbi:hypothetical protein HanPI659440_Chr02g0047341 [Helianthus annuus]|nr:hypothetical protein HanPI659440_Chr02g0047341 [Helianthus annuus]
MDGGDEKLTELKKAFAEVILNTAKEAAARIMVSQRKVLRLEIELKQAKEKALQMFMRLKQMMDAKNREAEMTSQAQQEKIEELEAQLQEAEDIVTVLREELSAAHAKRERAPQNSDKDVGKKGHTYYIFPSLKSRVNDKDLPAIILRGKGRKRNRSECTHAGENLHKDPSLVNEEEKDRKRRRSSGQVDRISCVSVSNAFSRLRKELERAPTRPPTPIREELVPTGREMPLHSETQLTGSRVIKYTYQRKREQGTNGSDLSKKLKNKNAALETGKVILEKSTPEEIEKVIPIETLTQETENVILTAESTEVEIGKVISTEESTEETEKVIPTEESSKEENVEQVGVIFTRSIHLK